MGMMKRVALLPMAVLFAVACSDRSPAPSARPTLNAQLRSDLDRAAAPTAELAISQFRATQGVSNVELGRAASTNMTIARHETPVRRVHPSLQPTIIPVSAAPTTAAPTPTVIAAAPVPQPGAGPRPTPNTVHYPDVGVIIRGGSIGDDDHCEIHRPGGTVMIGRSVPVIGIPMRRGGRRMGGAGPRPRGIW